MPNEESPFCPIAAEDIILEDDFCLAFYDRFPVSKGHALVIPKEAVASIYKLEPQVQTRLWDLVRRTRDILQQKFTPAGFNIGINDGAATGQTVPHSHIHIIPRYTGDVEDPRGGIRHVIPQRARYW